MSANQDNAVIVDVQTTEFDIVIMAGGVPQTVRTVAFADAGLSTEEKIRTIMNELTRTISFYNSNNNENPLTGSVPVFASGELETGMDFYRNFPAFEDYAVVPLQLTMEYPDSCDPAPYLPCLGMISQRLDGGGGRLSHIAQNSLPLRYQPQPVSMVRVLSIPGAVFAVVMLAFLIMTVLSVTGKIDSLNDMTENTRKTLEEKLAWSSEVSGEISALKKEIAAAETAGDNYGLVFDYMQNQRTRIDGDLTEIIKELPSTIILGQIQHNSTTMQVDGVAAGEKDVLQYITRLEDSRLFGGIVITDMSMNEGGSQNFSLLLDTSEMQSDISVIDVILRYFPADVSLTGLQQQGDTTIIRANAPDEESIVVFLEELESSALFEQISLDSQTDAADGTIDFVFTVKGMY
jgi:type IV pilus assembly protein PilM